MIFSPTPIAGAFLLATENFIDERGVFARIFCADEFAKAGLPTIFAQQSLSWNIKAGTLRGMHYQSAPYQEEKLVRVSRGAAFDVIVDLRPDSPSFKQWFGTELSAENRQQIFIPKGVAHGFQTLCPGTELVYQMTMPYHPQSARGVRWNDPAFGICWPLEDLTISPKDMEYPDFPKHSRRLS